MLKPFKDRVWSTYAFMEVVIDFIDRHHKEIGVARAQAFEKTRDKRRFNLDFAMDQKTRQH